MMATAALVVEVNKKDRTAKRIASFESRFMAEVAEEAFNKMLVEPWYNGKVTDIVYCWTPAEIQTWATAYGYLVIE